MRDDPALLEARRLRELAVTPRAGGDASKPAPVELPKPAPVELPKPPSAEPKPIRTATSKEPDQGKDDTMDLYELMGGARGAALLNYLPRDTAAAANTGGSASGAGGVLGNVISDIRGGVSGSIGGVDFGIQLPGSPGAPQPSASDPIPPELGAGHDPRTWQPPETDRPSPLAPLTPRKGEEWSTGAIAAAVAAGLTAVVGVGYVVARWVR